MTQLLTLLLFIIIHKTINVWNFYMILSCRFKETFNNLRSRSFILPKYASNYCQNAVVRLTSTYFRSIHPGVQPHLLKKVVLKICSKFTGEHPCRSVISIKLKSRFGMVALLYICCRFSEHLFLRTPLKSCFWTSCFFRMKKLFFQKRRVLRRASTYKAW